MSKDSVRKSKRKSEETRIPNLGVTHVENIIDGDPDLSVSFTHSVCSGHHVHRPPSSSADMIHWALFQSPVLANILV